MKKIMFFHDVTRKTRATCKISTFFEDLNFLIKATLTTECFPQFGFD